MNVMENYFCPYQYSCMLDIATTQRWLFLVKRENGERQEWCKIWLLSPRIKAKGQVGPWASLKRFSRNTLYSQALKRQLFRQKAALSKKSFISYTTGHNLRGFKISMRRTSDGLWQELRSGITTFWLRSIWDGGSYSELRKHSLVIRDTKGVWYGEGLTR